MEAYPLAERLVAGVRGLDDDALTPLAHARLLLRLGRPDQALALLPRQDPGALIAERPRDWNDVIALACLAARGDDEARGALMRWGADAGSAHGDQLADLLATIGAQTGDLALADDAARQLRPGGTPDRLRRRVTAVLAQRPRQDPYRIADTVTDCATALVQAQPPADEDPGVLTEVLDDLDRRGDREGPTLLLTALDRLRPGSPAIEAELRARAMRPRHWRSTWFLATLIAAFVVVCVGVDQFGWPSALIAGSVPGLVVTGWKGWPTLYPELGAADNAALRRIRSAGSSRAVTVTLGVLGSVCGAILALIAVVLVLTALDPDADSGDSTAADLALVLAVVAGLLCGPQLLLSLRRRSSARLARRKRAAGRAREAVDLGRCVCWNAGAIRGADAEGYADQHLVRSDPTAAAGLDLGGTLPAGVRECPDTRRRWLLVPGGDRGRSILLPGTVPEPTAPTPDTTAGGYL